MIRPATAADLDQIAGLVEQFLTATVYGTITPFDPDRVRRVLEALLAEGIVLVGERLGVVVGFIAGLPVEDPLSGEWTLSELAWWVTPAARGSSTGPRLQAAFEDWGRQQGLACIKMIAPSGSAVGHYYTRQGYTDIETHWLKRL